MRKSRQLKTQESQPVRRMEIALGNTTIRLDIIKYLSIEDQNLAIKARFCASVIDYENTPDKKEKLSKGRKIVANFIQAGSLFQLPLVPLDFKRDLVEAMFLLFF